MQEGEVVGCSERCCICGRKRLSYHNPDPLRNGYLDCCCLCNRMVIGVRRRVYMLPEEEQDACLERLRAMSYDELRAMFQEEVRLFLSVYPGYENGEE